MNIVDKFLAKVEEIIPHASSDFEALLIPCREFDGLNKDGIDEICFRESEYLGGMANVILQLI